MKPPPISEKAFQKSVLHMAYLCGWHIAHFNPAPVRAGRWITPQSGHSGFPDLVLARNGVVLIRELKTQRGALTPGQNGWLSELGAIAGVWRPSDMPRIRKELQ